MVSFDFVLECLVAVLLVITVVYCFVLERKLRALRSGQDGLKGVIEALDQATSRAEASLAGLKTDGVEAGQTLKDQIDAAATLAEELKLMVQAGDSVADRLAGATPGRNKTTGPSVPGTDKEAVPMENETKDGPDGLLKALRSAR